MDTTFSPRVVGAARPDYHCLESIVASPQFAGKDGEELVLAIYNHFTSRVDGTYHYWPSGESDGNPRVRRPVFDPIKILNAYGWAICGQTAHVLYGLYRAAGLPARQMALPGHSLCEVFYDGRWHILDVDMWTWFRTPAGHIASAAELATEPEKLIVANTDKSDPCNLPDRTLEGYAEMYAKTETAGDRVKTIPPPWAIRAHAMDFHLRPGETLIRSQTHEGRFHMPGSWIASRTKYRREWKGHPRERYEPFRTLGNGRWIYQPDLTAAAGDFPAGLWAPSDLAQDEAGLLGSGQAVWRIASPYPFCGVPEVRDDRIEHRDGVWLMLAGDGPARAELTDPEGRWVEVFAADGGAFDEQIDVTQWLSSRYDCLIRLTLAETARLRRLRFEGVLLTAPLSIPRLAEGDNPMELRCGDKHGLATVPWSRTIDFRDGADLPGEWADSRNAEVTGYLDGWRQISPAGEGPVSGTFRFDAPLAGGFAWAYVHASLREGPPDRPAGKAKLAWSADGRSWHDLSAGQITNTTYQWDCSIDGEVRFQNPLPAVDVRLTSDTAISGLEFHGHLACKERGDETLEITHRWREGGAERSFRAPPGAIPYVVRCGPAPEAHTIEMHAPSRPATDR